MANSRISSVNTNQILDKIQELSKIVDIKYKEIVKHNHISGTQFAEIHSYITEIIDLFGSDEKEGEYIRALREEFIHKREEISQLRKISELREASEIKEPDQRNQEMFNEIITNCINLSKNLKNSRIIVNDESNISSKSIRSDFSQESTIQIDFDNLISLFGELRESDEISDILYENIGDKIKQLETINERLNDEIERII
jgi:DNA-binding ferritin-like protein